MTEERDPKVSEAYRELGAQEPPRALDDAILAAARRAAGARPATLAAPAARGVRQRWYAPLATAALLVLAIAVTLNMQLERPGIESLAPQAVPPPAAEKELVKETAQEPAKPVDAEEGKISRRKAADQPAPSVAAAPAAPAAPAAREPLMDSVQPMAKRAEAQANQQALKQADTPERELEPIAELRAQGRHDEADKALAEFRKRYPDYRIPEAMRERLERR